MATLPAGNPIKCVITQKCEANPQVSLLVLKVRNQIQWKAAPPSSSYTLKLPGGYFEGHPNDFDLVITGNVFLPVIPLVAIKACRIGPYIYDSSGTTCATIAEPPEIIIGS